MDSQRPSLIILQLKSAHDETALSDLSKIISRIKNEYGYKIRGHEIHNSQRNMERWTLRERALMVSSFCSKNEIEYLTYHVPAPRNEGQSLSLETSSEKACDSIHSTLKEIEIVHKELGLEKEVVVIYHLPSVIGSDVLPYLNADRKFQILEGAERHLLDFYWRSNRYFSSFAKLTLENVFPKYFRNGRNYATINMFHPVEVIRLRHHGIGITFDLSHYNIYSNYLSYGRGNLVGDLDRQIYGPIAPSWNECIDLFGDSLFQLHISGGKGADSSGEGLILTNGEIPVIAILEYIRYGSISNGQPRYARKYNFREDRVIRATIELRDGHLHGGKLQRTAVEWLLTHAGNVFS